MKRLLILPFLLASFFVYAQVTITKSGGWFESAYVEWLPVNNAERYNVYFSGAGVVDRMIDDQLIRSYGGYFRADLLGLASGEYSVKIAPVVNGQESVAAVADKILVTAHDRTGFAFSNGRLPGAYKRDGTPKDGAVVLYITENTKNTVSLDVAGATANPCVGLQTILDGFKKGADSRPLIVRLVGQISDLEYMLNGDIVLENKNNASACITFEGVGEDAVADGWGIRLKNASNIEVRNIAVMNCDSGEGDNIGLQQKNEYVWVHHCDYFYGGAGGDADQAKGDGALDCKKSSYVTFSYNHFWDSGKCNLLGLSEGTTEGLFITYHHNWYDHSDSRHPRVRYYSAHVYNNYYDGNAKYGVGSTLGSSVFVEANYFRHCKYPILTSMQGSDVYDAEAGENDYGDMPTFSSEDGGTVKAYNNYMEGEHRFVQYNDPAVASPDPGEDFDAYVAGSRGEKVPASVVSSYGGNTYNNFDTDASVMYDYTAEKPDDARQTVISYAGRLNGGDFKWVFDNSEDDASYAVNQELKSALLSYSTKMVFVQGDGSGNGADIPVDTVPVDTVPPIIQGGLVHNFTLAGLTSSFYNISGNLSTSKGAVAYAGLSLTQCLKIESSTSISFTTDREAVLLLVFNADFAGDIKFDGVGYSVNGGILSLTIPAGVHTVTKGDTANLFYMSVVFDTGDEFSQVTLNLKNGWNLVSVPFDLPDSKVAVLFPHADIVKNFDAFYEKEMGGLFNMLSEIQSPEGYLLKNSIAEDIVLKGVATNGSVPVLQAGWNIVGSPWVAVKTVEEFFGPELSAVVLVKTFDRLWEADSNNNTLEMIEPGKAYFVFKQ